MTHERNQPSEARSGEGIPDQGGDSRSGRVDADRYGNLPIPPDQPGIGGVNAIGHSGGVEQDGQALPHGRGEVPAAGYLGRVEEIAAQAQREIKAMAESARRSIGQMTRLDVFWRRAGSIYHVLYLKSLEERLTKK